MGGFENFEGMLGRYLKKFRVGKGGLETNLYLYLSQNVPEATILNKKLQNFLQWEGDTHSHTHSN